MTMRKMTLDKNSVVVGIAAPMTPEMNLNRSYHTARMMTITPVRSQSHENSSRNLRLLTKSIITIKSTILVLMANIFCCIGMGYLLLLYYPSDKFIFPEQCDKHG